LRDRCHVVRMPRVTASVAEVMLDIKVRQLDVDLDVDACNLDWEAVIDASGHGHISLRQIRRILERLGAPIRISCTGGR